MNAVVAGLPKSWRHGAEHDDELIGAIEIVDALPRLVDHHQRVHPDVAFGMPLGFLLAADERLQLGKQLVDDAELEREREADRRPLGAQQQLFDLAPDALRRQIVEADRAAQRLRLLRRASARSARRTARARSTRRLSSPNVAGSTALSIFVSRSARPSNGSTYSPVSGSQEMALTVKSRRRAASSIDIDGSPSTTKPLCPRPGLRLAAGQPDVDRRRPCRPESSGRSARPCRTARAVAGSSSAGMPKTSMSRSFESMPNKPIAHPAADDERAAAALAHRARDVRRHKGSGSLFAHFEMIMANHDAVETCRMLAARCSLRSLGMR